MMLDRLSETLEQVCGLHLQLPLVVGVSGGPDSVCLLDGLHRLGYQPVVAHLNHKLREEAEADAEQVRRLAESWGLPFELESVDVRQFAEAERLSVEEAARILRYRFLFRQAEKYSAQAVVVAHTADDQVETVLMHLMRGTGLAGLKGMLPRWLPNVWSPTIPLVRPFLSFWRAEVLDYLEARGIQTVLDSSNLDIAYFRNRLRHELIPYLESYNPRVREAIWRTAHLLAGDYEALEATLGIAWENCVLESGPGYLAFDPVRLMAEPEGLRRLVIRRGIERLRPGLRDAGYTAIERALAVISDPARPVQVDLVAGLRLSSEVSRVWMATWEAELPASGWPWLPKAEVFHLNIPGEIRLPDGWVLRAEVISDLERAQLKARANEDKFTAWLSLDDLEAPMVLRARRPGERLQPLGMGGHSLKLSDLMINAKIPRRARDIWPLVCTDGEIVWVPGLRLAHPYRLVPGTRTVLRLRLWQPPEKPEPLQM